ncbi:MAG: type II toxin-antitoxin system VapC family toxin [Planctomycetes bacterium]|nr:type II toxin-antitoxin system VapC family toxin [Planctomycetota bacterium]
MNVYLDSSVILRLVFGEQNSLAGWKKFSKRIGSVIVEVECLRTLDRARIRYHLSGDEIVGLRADLFQLLETMEIVDLSRSILDRASETLPVVIGTLDAIHLATALEWKLDESKNIIMGTHDKSLAEASKACGIKVIGT